MIPTKMASETPKIERIKLKDLPAMAARFIDGAKPGTFIPITRHRAEAMVHNPNADPEDVAMLLATVGERCVGYFGVMAVMLQHEGKLHKVHWLTTWAVAPDFVGKGLGSRLMGEALALDVDLAIVGSKPARRVSAKYGFQEVKPLDFVEIDLGVAGRYNPISILLRLLRKLLSLAGLRLNIESISKPFELAFESLFGWFVRPILYRLISPQTLNVKKTAQVDQSTLGPKTGFVRDKQVVNWMLANPWVAAGSSGSENMDYTFSDARQIFQIFAWIVGDEFICFQRSKIREKRVVKVLDHIISDQEVLLAAGLKAAKEFDAHILEGPSELAEPLGNGWLARLLVRRKQRTLQVHPRSPDSPLGRGWQQLEQTYVDGDTAFT